MKIYQVGYVGADDNSHYQYFSSKSEAMKLYNTLKRIAKKQAGKVFEDGYEPEDDDRTVKQLWDMHEFNCEISAKGIIAMLNRKFYEMIM